MRRMLYEQAEIDVLVRRNAAPVRDIELPDDWGIHSDPDDIVFTARVIQRSQWACLPAAGGLDDQPAGLMRDVMAYFRLQDYIEAEFDSGDRDNI